MERRQMKIPLLIGGATTSPQHTAVKIAPAYSGSTVHVLDASLVVNVVSDLLHRREELDKKNRAEQERLRQVHAGKQKPLLTLAEARANRPKLEYEPLKPSFTGRREVDVDLATLVEYIDWTFFFTAWELRGTFPAILDDAKIGKAARELYENGRALLGRLVSGRKLRARGVYGFWGARADGDDVVLENGVRFCFLRQQSKMDAGIPNKCLADFVSPSGGDSLGAFAVGIHGAEEAAREFAAKHDDYSAIMVKALADRLAEAFAEYLHEQARRDWGISERWSKRELMDEKYRGIRPAFGYPACPDHSEKEKLFGLLEASRVGLSLTETFAVLPPASVCGLYFSHPRSSYFMVGKIGRDQLDDYAKRKASIQVERWLASNLA
jgi:5-methyltetrahydrofolate--homocysteine methyltransferase